MEASLLVLITGAISGKLWMRWDVQAAKLILKYGCALESRMMDLSIGNMSR